MRRLLAGALAFAAACGGPAEPPRSPVGWTSVRSFAYQLQRYDFDELVGAPVDLLVIDPFDDRGERWSAGEIAAVRRGPPAKRVLAYLSIGEAEDYRPYWRQAWDRDGDGRPDAGAPAWLGPSNPDWEGNYKVRYWMAAWRRTVAYSLDRIVEAGFDGVYLDIIDAYEFWRPRGRRTAARDMVRFVREIASRARGGNPSFGVFPQNGDALGRRDRYLAVVDGIGREDLFFEGSRQQDRAETRAGLHNLALFRDAGKLVLVVDYVTRPRRVGAFVRRARAHGFVPYATVRDLDRLLPPPP